MHYLIRISDGLNSFVRGVGKLFAWTLLVLIVLILFDVITRRFLVLGSTKIQEMEWHIHTVLFLMCLGYAYLENTHVRIELVRERLSARAKAWIELYGAIFFLTGYTALLIYFGTNFAYRSFLMGEISSALTGLTHRWIIKSFVPVGMLFLLLAGVSVALRNFVFLYGPDDLRERAAAHAPELRSPQEDLEKVKLRT